MTFSLIEKIVVFFTVVINKLWGIGKNRQRKKDPIVKQVARNEVIKSHLTDISALLRERPDKLSIWLLLTKSDFRLVSPPISCKDLS